MVEKEIMIARDVMKRNVQTVTPQTSLPFLEQKFLETGMSGFPVVDRDKLVGVVSRSDIVRQLCLERSIAEMTSDFYRNDMGFHEEPLESLKDIADRVGERMESITVQDVMIRNPISVSPDEGLEQLAERFVKHHIHRVLVTEDDRLVGIITTMDLVRLIAEGRVRPGG